MNIILFGPPGSGKGTQADRLVRDYGLKKVSTGDLLRHEIERKTQFGLEIAPILARGDLPDTKMVSRIFKKFIQDNRDCPGFVFDGYPRTIDQAEYLDKLLPELGLKLDVVLSLEVGDDVLIERIIGRIACAKCGAVYHEKFSPPKQKGICDQCGGEQFKRRSDDVKETLKQRFRLFRELTGPVIKFYERRDNFVIMTGEGSVTEISEHLQVVVENKMAEIGSLVS